MKSYQLVRNGNMKSRDPENANDHQLEIVGSEDELGWNQLEEIISNDDANRLKELTLKYNFFSIFRPQDAKRKQTLLHKAAEKNKLTILKFLIEESNSRKVSIDYPDYNGRSALFVAAASGNLNALVELIESGAHINARDNDGNSVLHEIIEVLKTSQRDESKAGSAITSNANEHHTMVLACLSVLIDNNDCDMESHNRFKMTPLCHAANIIPMTNAQQKNPSIIQAINLFVAAGASLEETLPNGKTAREILDIKNAISLSLINSRNSKTNPKPFLSEFLDAVILNKGFSELSNILQHKVRSDKLKASNSMWGNRTVLFHCVDKCDAKFVTLLLDNGANAWREEENGRLCLHRAFSRGNYCIVDALIDNMKNSKKEAQIDLSKYSFDLLKIFFSDSKNSRVKYDEYIKCFKRLLGDDVKLNLEMKNKYTSKNILQLAATCNNQDIIQLLLEKGSFIGCTDNKENGYKDILDVINLSTFNNAMDNCMFHHKSSEEKSEESEENIIGKDYTLLLNYKFLVPPTDIEQSDNEELSESKMKNYFSKQRFNENSHVSEVQSLRDIGQKRTLKKALTHPLLQTFIYAKWRKIMWLFYLNLFIYALFVIFLTLFLYSLTDLRMLQVRQANSTITNSIPEEIEKKSMEIKIYMGFLLPITFYMFLREFFQMIWTFKTYKNNFENYFEWTLVILVIVLSSVPLNVETTRHLAAWGMIIAWFEFIFILGRIPTLAIYVTMLRKVSRNFLRLLFLYSTLILGFSVSFNIILRPLSPEGSGFPFINFWSTLPKALVMATGEFDYSDLSGNLFSPKVIFSISAVLIFLLFLFLIFLVLMNVMNGLAVANTQEIMDEAVLYSLQSRLDLIYLIEKMIDSVPVVKWLLFKVFGYKKDLIFGYESPRFLVQVNNPHKSKRIQYGDVGNLQNCSLDRKTAELLRSHRANLVQEREAKLRRNPIEECLELLRELKDHSIPSKVEELLE